MSFRFQTSDEKFENHAEYYSIRVLINFWKLPMKYDNKRIYS